MGALKALMLRKKINDSKKELDALRAKDKDFDTREAQIRQSIDEAATDEEREAVEAEIASFDKEKQEHEDAKGALERTIEQMEKDLEEEEKEQDTDTGDQPGGQPADAGERNRVSDMLVRNRVFRDIPVLERDAMMKREDVKTWLGNIRTIVKEKRALQNVGLTIPEVFLGLLRQNVSLYSKLYKYVNVQPISGNGRLTVMGSVPEGIWTECCAILNELDLAFNDTEVDCYKVGGYFKVCNAALSDSDIDLASELLDVIGQAIGIALDKAIVYGRNTGTNVKMPLGIATRLAQTSQPSGYPQTARPWVDLHTTHILSIANSVTGVSLFQTLLLDSAVISGKYAKGEKVWIMNETTFTFLKAQAMSINAAGTIVSGMENTMPVIGGKVEVLDFMPDYIIAGGYLELYLLAERGGAQFAESEHVFFIQDHTAFKGTARYDGTPVIAEAFAIFAINGATFTVTDVTFAADNANVPVGILLDKAQASVAASGTLQLKATLLPAGVKGTITWASSNTSKATVDTSGKVTGVASGSAVITASCGGAVAVCNLTVTS